MNPVRRNILAALGACACLAPLGARAQGRADDVIELNPPLPVDSLPIDCKCPVSSSACERAASRRFCHASSTACRTRSNPGIPIRSVGGQ